METKDQIKLEGKIKRDGRTLSVITTGNGAKHIAIQLVDNGAEVSIEPLPNSNYRVTVMDKAGNEERLLKALAMYPANPEKARYLVHATIHTTIVVVVDESDPLPVHKAKMEVQKMIDDDEVDFDNLVLDWDIVKIEKEGE